MKTIQNPIAMTITLLLLSLASVACKDDGTSPPPERIKLTLIDVSVKETYLHIAITNPASNEMLSLQRNGATVMTFSAVADTNIADTALTQTTAYQYTARLTANDETTGTSNTISAQTLAPTSHNFTWQTFLLGDGNNSSLYDVAIINDTLIYAVGEMYLRDSTGAIGDDIYNLAKWDGRSWSILRVPYQYQGSPFYGKIPWMFALSANDIWFGNSTHWDGQRFHNVNIADAIFEGIGSNRMWGSPNGSFYVVGNGGTIAFSSNRGVTWQRLSSGTTSIINDVWGVPNPVSGRYDVYCVASAFFAPDADKKILRIQSITRVDSIPWGTGRNIFGIWSARGFPLFTAGSGVFENSRGRWNEAPLPAIYTNAVRGNSVNDVVVVGDFGFAAHYNGDGWFVLLNDFAAGYSSVAVQSNLVVAVGNKNAKGLITIGRRQ